MAVRIFSDLLENHTPCKYIRNSGQRIQTIKYFIETQKTWCRIFFQMKVKVSSSFSAKAKIKT